MRETIKQKGMEMKKETLTKENAHKVATISNKANPEWGKKRFYHECQELNDGLPPASGFGKGTCETILFESEFKFWNIESYKS
jgi:hypothetical protein